MTEPTARRRLFVRRLDTVGFVDKGDDPKAELVFFKRKVEKYDPDQPRVPAGNSTGGQWTDGDGNRRSGSLKDAPYGEIAEGTGSNKRAFFSAVRRKDAYGEGRFSVSDERGGGDRRPDAGGVGSGSRSVLKRFTTDAEYAEAANALGVSTPDILEISDPAEFHNAISAAKAGHPFGESVTVYSPEAYSGMRLFMTEDGTAGFALNGDDIVSVFKAKGSPHRGWSLHALNLATSQGGRRLDAFDTELPHLYALAGFEVVGRTAFVDEYAPEGWDYGRYAQYNKGRPDVVAMVYRPRSNGIYTRGSGQQFPDYDSMIAGAKAAAYKKFRGGTRMLSNLLKALGWKPGMTEDDVDKLIPPDEGAGDDVEGGEAPDAASNHDGEQTMDKSKLSPDAVREIEALEKKLADAEAAREETVSKIDALSATVEKLNERAETAEKRATALEDAREAERFIQKVRKDYDGLPTNADDFAPILRKIAKTLDESEMETFETVLKAASAQLQEAELTKQQSATHTTATSVEKKVEEMAKQRMIDDPSVKDIAAARGLVWKENPGLRIEYEREVAAARKEG